MPWLKPNLFQLLLLLFFGLSLVVAAPAHAASPQPDILLPNSRIYFLEQAREWAEVTFVINRKQLVNAQLDIAQHRVKEANYLTAEGNYDLALAALQDYNKVIERTVALTKELSASGDTATSSQVVSELNLEHQQVVAISKNPAISAHNDVVDAALFAQQWSVSQVKVAAASAKPVTTSPPASASSSANTTSSSTPQPVPTPPISSLAQALVQSDTDSLVSETIPDGSAITPGTKFTKTWVIKNSGPVTWKGYKILPVKGVNLSASKEIDFGATETVPPGATKTISIEMVSPSTPGSYYSGWQLANGQGSPVGGVIFANIVVPQPPPPPKATPKPAAPAPQASAVAPTPSTGWIKVPILMYHYVRTVDAAKDPLGFALSVTPSDFDQQLSYLSTHGYHAIDLDAFYNAVIKGTALPSLPVVLTFDDGYVDFYTTALPTLQKYGFTAVSYVVPGFIGNPAYMSWDQITQAKARGVEIASHTVHHVNLPSLKPADALAELTVSKTLLEQHLGIPIVHFAYPYGAYSDAVASLVAKAGYITATTTYGGNLHNKSLLLALRRVRISGGDTLQIFASKVR